MDDTFKTMIESLYQNEAFTEWAYIDGFKTKCFVSSLTDNLVYTEAGLQSDCNFVLDVLIESLPHFPNEGDKVVFREKTYKISSFERDSANVCVKLYLISTSKGA